LECYKRSRNLKESSWEIGEEERISEIWSSMLTGVEIWTNLTERLKIMKSLKVEWRAPLKNRGKCYCFFKKFVFQVICRETKLKSLRRIFCSLFIGLQFSLYSYVATDITTDKFFTLKLEILVSNSIPKSDQFFGH
jgi:hypothetical protein